MDPVVTSASLAAIVVTMILGVSASGTFARFLSGARNALSPVLQWYYVLLVAFFLALVIWLGVGRYKNVRLGHDDERPEFRLFPWLSMLFAAGTGVGLLFWSIAEPVTHYLGNPYVAAGQTPEAAVAALRLTFFHWGLNGWAIFSIVGLLLGYFSYRKGLPLTVRSALYPLIGERIFGFWGNAVDTFAVVATVFGITTTLGLGARQMNSGMQALFGTPVSNGTQMVIVVVVTLLATLSVVSGLRRGVRVLSEINIYLSFLLLAYFLLFGPTNYLLALFVQASGDYLENLAAMSFFTDANGQGRWVSQWTVFYWGWWIAWSPFVGMFIARISRGRKFREYVMGVLLVPTLVTFVWVTVFGGTALHIELFGDGGIAGAVNQDVAQALYVTIDAVGAPGVVALAAGVVATALIAIYFVTSADSGTLVITTILSRGGSNPPIAFRIVWGLMVGVLTGILLLAGGLPMLQDSVVLAGVPFSVIMLVAVAGFLRALQYERFAPLTGRRARRAREPWTGED
jgi:choline/glycine/proline betaine transport protein